jgi:hypothetical protein
MSAYTTTKLLTAIERQSFAPTNQDTFSTSDILSLADEVTKTTILPAILKTREEYYVDYEDYSVTANTASYEIPERAIGLTVREVHLIDGSGNVKNLARTSIDRLPYRSTSTSGTPEAFYLQSNSIVLIPTPSSSINTLRVYYAQRPGNLVVTTEAATIASINTSTNVITVTTIPSTWTTGDTFDLIQATGGHRYLDTSLTSTLISGTSITLPSLPTGLAVGDYIALENESPVVQLPPDFQPILATLVAAEMLLAMSQPQGEKVLAKGIRNLEAAQKMITPRVFGEDELILPDWS